MKRALSIVLVLSLIFSCLAGCGKTSDTSAVNQKPQQTDNGANTSQEQSPPETEVHYTGLDDPELLQYVKNTVYAELLEAFPSEEYVVDDVSVTFVSKEYIEELSYNSKSNLFFGYTLKELDEQFQGTRYVFTLGENGETVVQQFQAYDDTYEKAVKDAVVAAAGVILVICTLTHYLPGVAQTIRVVLTESATNPMILAEKTEDVGSTIYHIVKCVENQEIDPSLMVYLLKGNEALKWVAAAGFVVEGVSKIVNTGN